MALLSVKDETTGQIKPWVWVVGAGFAIGGAALFLSSGGSSSGGTVPGDTTGLGDGSGLDSLEQSLQDLLDHIDNTQPNPPGGGSGGGGTGSQPTTGGQGVKGVPVPTGTINTRPVPTTGSTGTTSSFGRLLGPPTPITSSPTSSPSVTGIPTGSVSTGRTTAVSTGSINVYPVSKQVNPGPPESIRRNPVLADI